ncbi:MAG: Uncharacterised protein [Cellulomonadaceae bacterium TMED98]|nr:MAG: Uncharacterised protein [Cellulomonadaceae bacterium TMED98]
MAQHVKDLIHAVATNDVAHTHKVNIVSGNLDGEIALLHIELQIELFLAFNGALLDFGDGCRPVMGVDNGFSYFELHSESPS